ncbi:MAG: hypothetical protein IT445_06175 [Phycisphaeraceae bacterium]|nr:hypothetical protein [Phycisphaeraceae bacterium]
MSPTIRSTVSNRTVSQCIERDIQILLTFASCFDEEGAYHGHAGKPDWLDDHAAAERERRAADIKPVLHRIITLLDSLAQQWQQQECSHPAADISGAKLITKSQVASKLGVSTRTLDRGQDRGVMPAGRKVGGKLMWDQSVIDRWIKAGMPKVRRAPTSHH